VKKGDDVSALRNWPKTTGVAVGCLASGLVLLARPALAQDVDWQSAEFLKCDAAANGIQVDEDNCYDAEVGRLSKAMDGKLREIKKKATPKGWSAVDKAQTAWRQFQDAQCKAVYETLGGNRVDSGTDARSEFLYCQAQTYAERMDQLEAMSRWVFGK
jgi:uncharacterized protein YecT (DUF1311 family)